MSRKREIWVINGPNLNLLGKRQPDIYGKKTLADLERDLSKRYDSQCKLGFFQSNIEGEIINLLQKADNEKIHGIVLNPGAFTHYALAVRDAMSSISVPVIEVHISNIYRREAFRHKSVTAPEALGQISGFGFDGYRLAIEHLLTI